MSKLGTITRETDEHKQWKVNIKQILVELSTDYPVSEILMETRHIPNNVPNTKEVLWSFGHRVCILYDVKDKLHDKSKRIVLTAKFDVTCKLENITFGFEVGNCVRNDNILKNYYHILYFDYMLLRQPNSYDTAKNTIRTAFDRCPYYKVPSIFRLMTNI